MSDDGYAFISAYLKGEEARIIGSGHINSMTRLTSVQDIMDAIRETDIGTYLEGASIKTFNDVDNHLWRYLDDCFSRLERFASVTPEILKLLGVYINKYDVLNIKAALLGISSGRKASMVPVGVISKNGLLEELSDADDTDGIADLLVKCGLHGYAAIVEEYGTDEGDEARLPVESKLDNEYYRTLVRVAEQVMDGSMLARALGTMIDMTNLQLIFRAVIGGMAADTAGTISGGYRISVEAIREMMSLKLNEIPDRLESDRYSRIAEEVVSSYDKGKNISVVDEIIEKHKFKMSRETLSPRVMSPLMAVWYFIVKETELRNLRLILKAVFDNITVDEIKDYLVMAS